MVNEYERIVKTDIRVNVDYMDPLLNFKNTVHIFVKLGGGFFCRFHQPDTWTLPCKWIQKNIIFPYS